MKYSDWFSDRPIPTRRAINDVRVVSSRKVTNEAERANRRNKRAPITRRLLPLRPPPWCGW